MGVIVWPMVEWEADDALAAAAGWGGRTAGGEDRHGDPRQGPRPARPWQARRPVRPAQRECMDAAGVVAKFGVAPAWCRLAGPGRRHRRRLPGHPRLGSQVGGGGACRYGTSRQYPPRPSGTSQGFATRRPSRPRWTRNSSTLPGFSSTSPQRSPTSTSAASTTGSGSDDGSLRPGLAERFGAANLAERAVDLATRRGG